jgi:hypothetical protein
VGADGSGGLQYERRVCLKWNKEEAELRMYRLLADPRQPGGTFGRAVARGDNSKLSAEALRFS